MGVRTRRMRTAYPFSAIVGQDEMKLALLIAATDPGIGGVMVFGDRGTGKSTAVRAPGGPLPPIEAVRGACSIATQDPTRAAAQATAAGPNKQDAPTEPSQRRWSTFRWARPRIAWWGRSTWNGRYPRRKSISSRACWPGAHRGLPLHRRSKSAGGLPGRSSAGRRRVGRKRRRTGRV